MNHTGVWGCGTLYIPFGTYLVWISTWSPPILTRLSAVPPGQHLLPNPCWSHKWWQFLQLTWCYTTYAVEMASLHGLTHWHRPSFSEHLSDYESVCAQWCNISDRELFPAPYEHGALKKAETGYWWLIINKVVYTHDLHLFYLLV